MTFVREDLVCYKFHVCVVGKYLSLSQSLSVIATKIRWLLECHTHSHLETSLALQQIPPEQGLVVDLSAENQQHLQNTDLRSVIPLWFALKSQFFWPEKL